MHPVLRALYGGAGLLARAAVATGIPGHGKLARTVNERRGLLTRYQAFGATDRDVARPLIWFHAPSVGEGLQATPVMTRLRERHADLQIAYTHFSPSAAAFARSTGADFADYLPFDSAHDVKIALDALRPAALIFSKLDVWPLLVAQAVQRGVSVGMISATLSETSGRRHGLAAAVARNAYAALQAVGAIDDADASRLVQIGVRERVITITGDTRYDQVWARAQQAASVAPWLDRFRGEPRVTLVAGSSWPADEAVLLPAWRELTMRFPGALRLIIAPHEPIPEHLHPIEQWATGSALRCVRLDGRDDASADVVLVDRVGVLGELYGIADAAFVGGGFHAAGLHSVLEPAAFGVPVVFGPRFGNSRDAELLLDDAAACSVPDGATLVDTLASWLAPANAPVRRAVGARALARVQRGRGAADRAAELVLKLLRR